jgi:hypothetical protein
MGKSAVIQKNVAMPEFITRREDMESDRTWEVEGGQAARGEAWTDLDAARMRVPFGDDEASRVIRSHELMHARVSPRMGGLAATHEVFAGINPKSVIAAEEFRVNTLIQRAGFDTDHLRDGSEFTSGERCAERGAWNDAVTNVGAMAGTKACADFLRGVKKIDADWAKALREIEKSLINAVKKIPTDYLANTREVEGLPRGFYEWTRKLAEIIRIGEELGNKPKIDEEGNITEGESEEIDPTKMKEALSKKNAKSRGKGFADPVFDILPLTRRVSGHLGRKRVATNVGRNPRRMGRMLTDPQRRVFDRTIKGTGGIVLIDQSGSMHISDTDLWALLEAAPGCTVIGYSHRPGSTTMPNIWVLAEGGRVCEEIRKGNGGNGVDGPALEFAITKRKKGEPIIWVCDGMVTDCNDQGNYRLAEDCASLVVRAGIHMVEGMKEAVEALTEVKGGKRLQVRGVGQIRNTATFRSR